MNEESNVATVNTRIFYKSVANLDHTDTSFICIDETINSLGTHPGFSFVSPVPAMQVFRYSCREA